MSPEELELEDVVDFDDEAAVRLRFADILTLSQERQSIAMSRAILRIPFLDSQWEEFIREIEWAGPHGAT